MSEILQTNIFFVITSVAVIVFTFFACMAVYYIVRILRTVAQITERVDEKSEEIIEDMSRIRTYVVTGKLIRMLTATVLKAVSPNRSRSTREVAEDDINIQQ